MKISKLGEFGLIDRIAKRLKISPAVIRGIGDDTAVLRYKRDRYLLFTTDMLIENTHFSLKKDSFFKIGWKALSCCLSDIAAMGGVPSYALISIGIPVDFEVSYIDEIYRGIEKVAKRFKVDVVGGDMDSSDKLIINVAMIGEVEKKRLCFRSGAKLGDVIFVTGELGGSIKGKHLEFIPRLKEARWLVNRFKINSMIDISDGLLQDLGHILRYERLGAILYKDKIPVSEDARGFKDALINGEDFELLFTVSKEEAQRIKHTIQRRPFRTKLTQIGEVVRGSKGVTLLESGKRSAPLVLKGYRHF